MAATLTPDLCIIGAGSAGLSIAAGAVQMGAEVVLIEKAAMGGDCLNTGCVPSKALLAAGKAAAAWRHSPQFGVTYAPPRVDAQAVHDHVHRVIAAIAPMDSQERLEGLGVTVIRGEARFLDSRELEVAAEGGAQRVRARRYVVASGSQPLVPPIPGIDQVDYLTNETVFALTALPQRLIVIGGGPIGCELGQAFRNLGAEVEIVEMGAILPKDDPELVEVLRRRLRDDGVVLHEQARVVAVEKTPGGLAVKLQRDGGKSETLTGSHLLVAAGRKPTLECLGLDAAGIAHDRKGIVVDARLRSSNKRVYAAGDVAGGLQFTHVAAYHAGVILKNALFRLPAKADTSACPWVTYCDPELAQVGMTEALARENGGEVEVLTWPFAENDRAQAERRTEGMIKVVATPGGMVLGVGIVGPGAGELILPWALALSQGIKLGALAQVIAPYPTLGEVSKRAAGSHFTPKLFSSRIRWLVRFLARFG
ncbi:MAG: FAD-dependent oxidoreductase [Rhodovibrionaceae bacterium]